MIHHRVLAGDASCSSTQASNAQGRIRISPEEEKGMGIMKKTLILILSFPLVTIHVLRLSGLRRSASLVSLSECI